MKKVYQIFNLTQYQYRGESYNKVAIVFGDFEKSIWEYITWND